MRNTLLTFSGASAITRLNITSLFTLAIALGGCGSSGSDGGVASTPVPSAAPPVVNTQLPLTETETFNQAASAKIVGTVDTRTGAVEDVTLPSRASFATLSVAYNATRNTYTVADEASSKTFAPADLTAGTSSFDHYTQTTTVPGGGPGSTTVSDLYLFRPGVNNSRLSLTYATYGVWATSQQGSSNTRLLSRFATFGVQTLLTSMPRTGSGTYTGIVDGVATVDNQAYRLTGSSGTVTANFATGVVRTNLALVGNPDVLSLAEGNVALGSLTGTGAIANQSNRYTGTISGLGASGSFGGGFYGPNALETAFAFSLNGDTNSAVGVFVGKK
jgi:hypothetical protein